jgi:hypothetical protein
MRVLVVATTMTNAKHLAMGVMRMPYAGTQTNNTHILNPEIVLASLQH